MIIDSHCHAWLRWPYQPPVPDHESRARVEQLLFEMDQNGVDKAVIVCARIEHNPDNNEYIAEQVKKYPDRLVQFADVDCFWWSTYRTPGAADRLAETAERLSLTGFTHYLSPKDDADWLVSDEGMAFFGVAAERKLIASICCYPQHHWAMRQVAERYPTLPILIHHLGMIKGNEPPPHQGLQEVLASARCPNIFLKLSGFYYSASVKWDFPYWEVHWIVRTLYQHYGANRMCWGTDYPVVRRHMTHRQSLECFRTHCSFVPEDDKALILGETLNRLLETRAVSA